MRLIVQNTNKPLVGKIHINGSKNAALAIIAACNLSKETIRLKNIPYITDIIGMVEILKSMGAHAEFHLSDHDGNHELEINCSKVFTTCVPSELAKTIRAAILLLGPLLARHGKARVSVGSLGGCVIGERAVDLHLKGFESLGSSVEIDSDSVEIKVGTGKLYGKEIQLPFQTVGATANILMGAVLAKGETIIRNAATEPDITDLANFLVSMGARITGIGTRELIINGVDKLHSCEYTIIPDRHEAGTYALAGIVTQGNLELVGVQIEDFDSILKYLRMLGAIVTNKPRSNSVVISSQKHFVVKSSIDIATAAYPGFPTDMQPQLCLAIALSAGNHSHFISETIFNNRFIYITQLKKMGAKIDLINKSQIKIFGDTELNSGEVVYGTDLRATAALVLAALVAKGNSPTIIENIEYLLRGYEGLPKKLNGCGASIQIEY